MTDQQSRAELFHELHRKSDPIIIYNVWDGGSAKAVLGAGAKAIATGDHPVGFAHGFSDDNFDEFTFDTYLSTIKEIAAVVDGAVPMSVDISNAEGLNDDELKARIETLLNLGVVGVNFEDRKNDTELRSADEQARLIGLIREAADEKGVNLFINARTDIFALHKDHESCIDEAVDRAHAYEKAGANGFFAPGLSDITLIKDVAGRILLPLNIIRLPGTPSAKELESADVSRISYGPVPQMQMSEWLESKARNAFALKD